jgi:hypothetical protein
MQKAGLPVGLIWFDRPWATGKDGMPPPFEWNSSYPNGAGLTNFMHEQGIVPGVWVAGTMYNPLQDFSDWVQIKNHTKPFLEAHKTKMYKLDRISSGHISLFFKLAAYYEAWKDVFDDDFIALVRGVSHRCQRYANGKWSGDNDAVFDFHSGLKANIAVFLNYGISGFPFWGSDIGGYLNGPNDDLILVRWCQFGAFTPIMEIKANPGKDFPKYGHIYNQYARLYTQFFPYRWTYANIAVEKGIPIGRALALEYPEDPIIHQIHDEYLYGDHLLVAPVTDSGTSRDIYLPQGKWIDWWDGKWFAGKQTIADYKAPHEKLPLFMRAGAIIPLIEVTDEKNQTWKDSEVNPLIVRMCASGNSSFTIRPDSIIYQNQTKSYTGLPRTHFQMDSDNNQTNVSITGSGEMAYKLKVYLEKSPRAVYLNGSLLTQYADSGAFGSSAAGWITDTNSSNHIADIKIPDSLNSDHFVIVSYSTNVLKEIDKANMPGYSVSGITPNPFYRSAKIDYRLHGPSHIEIQVYNCRGERIETLVDAFKKAGHYSASLNTNQMGSGVYYFKIYVNDRVLVRKAILLK